LPLDIRELHRRRCLLLGSSGPWRWTWSGNGEDAGSIGYSFDGDNLRLKFNANGESNIQMVPVVRTLCHFGGWRPWFLCPVCSRRVGILYARAARFACRDCQRVAYLSQSEDRLGRAWRKQRKLERFLSEDGARPKGMHKTTYARILGALDYCEQLKDADLVAKFQRWGLLA
jgi:hypothetical protein